MAGLASLASGVFLHRAIGQHMADQVAERLRLDARLARDLYGSRPLPEESTDALADRLGRDLSARVTFIGPDGRVLGDTDIEQEALPGVENHLQRPEVQEALRKGHGMASRFSSTVGETMLYVALRLDPDHPGQGVVRVAVPLTAVRIAQERIRLPLLGATLLSLVAAGLLGWMAARRPSRRLEEMSRIASEIAAGNTAARAVPGGSDEMGDLARSLNRMADQLAERLSLLSRERSQLLRLLDGMVEGVILTDDSGTILLANRAFERIFSANAPVQGLRPLEAARIPALQEAVEAALMAGEPVTREIVLPGAVEKVLRASLAAIREGLHTLGAVVVFHDVTELKNLEKIRREFVANVSHELRTPLTAIRGYAETLRDSSVADPSRVGEFADVIHRHARRLQILIEDLLDLSSIEHGNARIELGAVALREPVSQAEALVGPTVRSRRQTFSVRLPADLPHLRADRDRLAQVLINLLDNAVKFTPEGGKVELSAASANGRVIIEVRDNGVGIPPEDLPRIFERFYRVDRSRDRREGGTGLGLAIAKHLTQGMGGSIEVESTPGTGTTFRLSFPTL